MITQQFFIDGLGCASYLIGCEGEGVAAVVDPDRDVEKYIRAAEERGMKITHIIETHLHADHVSGNTELSRRTGAKIYMHEDAGAEFPVKHLREGDSLRLGNVDIQVLHTPGHTPESITLLISDTSRSDEPWLALTGDTLFVGDIGRPDLVGMDAARNLAESMYSSLFKKILPLDDGLLIYPGHGIGSLCGSKSIGAMRTTTLGYERRSNDALQERSLDEFVEDTISTLPEQPANTKRIKQINREGPNPLGDIAPKALSIRDAIPHFQRGAAMLDTRPKAQFVEKYVPGAIHMEADDQLSNKVGYVLHPDQPVILLVEGEAIYCDVVFSLARVGFDKIVGYIEGGIEEWEARGLPVTSGDIEDITPHELHNLLSNGNGNTPVVLDVREPWEYGRGHIPDAVHIPLGQLQSRLRELDPDQPVAVICAHGNRSQSAAALLGQSNFQKIYNVINGTEGWTRAGLPLAR